MRWPVAITPSVAITKPYRLSGPDCFVPEDLPTLASTLDRSNRLCTAWRA